MHTAISAPIRRLLKGSAPLLLAFIFLSACSKDSGEGPEGGVGLRVENQSSFTLQEVQVMAGGGGEHMYFDIAPGIRSEYKNFDYTYRYGFVQAIIEGDTLTLQPTDYVGEKRFTEGNFTFVLDVIGELTPLYLVLEFREE